MTPQNSPLRNQTRGRCRNESLPAHYHSSEPPLEDIGSACCTSHTPPSQPPNTDCTWGAPTLRSTGRAAQLWPKPRLSRHRPLGMVRPPAGQSERQRDSSPGLPNSHHLHFTVHLLDLPTTMGQNYLLVMTIPKEDSLFPFPRVPQSITWPRV